jgi:exodeoxyribonuclease V alpha subunit
MSESLSGVIERITFQNQETGFTVLRVDSGARRGIVTLVGTLPSAVAGEFVEAKGAWVQNRDHGLQFKADEVKTTPPHSAQGIARYLGSGLVKGIGPHFAKKIVEVFGERTLAVIDESPSFLAEVKGIGPKRMQQIRQSWAEQKAVRSVMVFLQSHGIGTARAVRICKTYGDQAISIIRTNPYRLASDIWGIGFQIADELAGRLGIDRSSPVRAQAAIRYVLHEFSQQGHVGFPEAGVVQKTGELTQIGTHVIQAAIDECRRQGEIVSDSPHLAAKNLGKGADLELDGHGSAALEPTAEIKPDEEPWLFLKPLFLAEVGVARLVKQLRGGPHPMPAVKIDAAVDWVEQKMKLTLAETQRKALRAACTDKVLILTGGPGTGKTTIVRGILDIFAAKGMRCALCAPTGRAAKRLSEATGREARTIHRLLEFDPGLGRCKRDREHPLGADLLVVDETSMVDVALMNQLLRAIPPTACLLLVGDVDQLPSVGPGAILADLIASGAAPVVRLTDIFRQAGQSWIVRAAHAVNHGEEPESAAQPDGDFFFIEAATPETIMERILALVRERIPQRFHFDPLRDVQILTPMNRSELGVRNLNMQLQEILNPPGNKHEIQRFGWTFRVGDKVMQTVNNYQKEIFNGDIGRVTAIEAVDQDVRVDFDGREVSYDFGELDELTLAYACSVHKSQGGEYPAVIIPLHTQHYMLLQRNLLYTAITRGRRLVVIVGSRKALSLAVQRQDTKKRFSLLRQRLQGESPYLPPMTQYPLRLPPNTPDRKSQ